MNKQEKIEKRRAYDREWKRKKYLENPEKYKAYKREQWKKMKEDPEKAKKYREHRRIWERKYRKTEKYRISHLK